jgi:parallel beta-helix repeat protein
VRGTIGGNFVGVDVTGSSPIANGDAGVEAERAYIVGNVLSGNAVVGARLVGESSLERNLIGVDGSGSAAVPNGVGESEAAGVEVDGSGLAVKADIGGSSPGDGNVISGNAGPGIRVLRTSSGPRIRGNLIGTDTSGNNALPNAGPGIVAEGSASGTLVGWGSFDDDRNSIAGNLGSAVLVLGPGNAVLNNDIGVARDGSRLENLGPALDVRSDRNVVDGNMISSNGAGVVVSGSENEIVGNVFRRVRGAPIDLGGDGATPNDAEDADEGANHLVNTPVIDEAVEFGDRAVLRLHVDASPEAPGATTVELYRGSECPTAGVISRAVPLDRLEVMPGEIVTFVLRKPQPPGWVFTATRTDGAMNFPPPDRNTSELATCATPDVRPEDVSAPAIQVAFPNDGARYTAGYVGVLDIGCDDGAGSGVTLCTLDGAEDGTPGPAMWGPTHEQTSIARSVDLLGNEAIEPITYQVIVGTAHEVLGEGGGIVDTDPSGIGANPYAPMQTAVFSYAGGDVVIEARDRSSIAPLRFRYAGQEVVLAAPHAPDAVLPTQVTFRLDASIWDERADALRAFRDGELVGRCTVAEFVAEPDPCTTRGVRLADGDVEVKVYGLDVDGVWNFGSRIEPFEFAFRPKTEAPPVVNVLWGPVGGAPTSFTLGGYQGIRILQRGSPTWHKVPCWKGAEEDPVRTAVPTAGPTYEPFRDRYTVTPTFQQTWIGTCRVLKMAFVDGSRARVRYRFT